MSTVGQRRLHEDAVDLGARVESFHDGRHLGRGGGRGQPHRLVEEAELVARPCLAADVDGGGGIVADQQRAQAEAQAARNQRGHARAQLFTDGAGGGGAVEDAGGHRAR